MSLTWLSVRNGAEVVVVTDVGARGAPVAAQVGRDHVISRRGDRQHHLSPAVRQLGEPVEQQDGRAVLDSKPASSTCILRPLTLSTKRERMPGGSTDGLYGTASGTLAVVGCWSRAFAAIATGVTAARSLAPGA